MIGGLKGFLKKLGDAFSAAIDPQDPIAREGMQRELQNPVSLSSMGPRVRDTSLPSTFEKQ